VNKIETWERNIPCNNCGATNTIPYMDAHVKNWYDNEPLKLVQCVKCDLVYPDPRPPFTRILRIMEGDFGEKVFRRKEGRRGAASKFIDKRLSAILKFKEDAETLFDVGYGAGLYLMAGKRMGLHCYGNEINSFSVEEMTRRGFIVYQKPTCDLWMDKDMDVILCHDNIEHTYTPRQDLRWMGTHQKSGGILNIRTLYLGCPRHVAHGEQWNLFGAAHFHYYFPHVLVNMIQDAGYNIIRKHEGNLIDIIARRK